MCSDAPTPPSQVTYGESMAKSLKTQADFLKGTGEFAEVGSLESLLPLEESIRKKTAQTDTDRPCWAGRVRVRLYAIPKRASLAFPMVRLSCQAKGQAQGAIRW